MSSRNSYTATLSPTTVGTEGFPPHMLSSSISSLPSARQSSQISKTYKQASTLFLTRRLPEALSTILPVIEPPPGDAAEPAPVARASRSTRIKVWTLYLTILNAILELDPDEGKDAFGGQEWRALCNKVRDGDVWEEVVRDGYHGIEGDVDTDVVINLATLLLAHARTQSLNQRRLETYLASSSTPNFDLTNRFTDSPNPSSRFSSRHRSPAKRTGGTDTPRDLNARVKVLELYTLHVLIRNNEWDYAREFISVSSVLDDERREAFLQALESLQEEQQEAERQEREARQQEEDRLRRDLEEARRLRAENEERERKRVDEQRARRQGSEVDYGIENSPSVAGSSSHSARKRGGSSASGGPASPKATRPRPKAKAGPVALTLGQRAGMMVSGIGKLVEQLGASMRSNPMLLMRLMAFIVGILLTVGRKSVRERLQRLLGNGYAKVMATAGMATKVSYM